MKKNNFEDVNIDHFTDLMKAINLHVQHAHQITFKNDAQTSQLHLNQWGKNFKTMSTYIRVKTESVGKSGKHPDKRARLHTEEKWFEWFQISRQKPLWYKTDRPERRAEPAWSSGHILQE